MPLLPPGKLVHVRPNAPILELWENGAATVALLYPGTMLAPGHYSVLIAELLAAGFAVAGVHFSGHGECREQSDFVFSDLLAEGLWAEAWLRQNGFASIVVCGHSQGGILALAHASESATIAAAFALSAVFPEMADAIGLTRLAGFRERREQLMAGISRMAQWLPGMPVPLPVYLELRRIMAGRRKPLFMGRGRGRISYPLRFLASLFAARIRPQLNCPFLLFNACDDALFTPELTCQVFERLECTDKRLVWLPSGGHMAPLNPGLAQFVARHIAAACAGLGLRLNLKSGRRSRQ